MDFKEDYQQKEEVVSVNQNQEQQTQQDGYVEDQSEQGLQEAAWAAKIQGGEQEPNKTGIPDDLKAKLEQEFSFDLSKVRVHYNASIPPELNAVAYAKGLDVYISKGNEKHLEHELRHVIQQMKGEAKATETINGEKVDTREKMEVKASKTTTINSDAPIKGLQKTTPSKDIVQRVSYEDLAEKESINSIGGLKAAIEHLLDTRYSDIEGLFRINDVATSTAQWRNLFYDHMSERYELNDFEPADILAAIQMIKDENRAPVLLRIIQNRNLFEASDDNIVPYSLPNLKERLADMGVYLEEADDEVLGNILETDGQFGRIKVELGGDCLELIDEDNIVVIMDGHQNKHQNPPIQEFPAYNGGPGSKFAIEKDLDWHRANTAETVKETVQGAINQGLVTADGAVHCPPKDAIDGVIYDLSITYDFDTGKYVGSYHCNPVNNEQ